MKNRTIILIRHAECEHHLTDLTGGWTDDDLTGHGMKQAEVLASDIHREYSEYKPMIYSSDLKRTKQTASVIAKLFETNFLALQGLNEHNNGLAANKTVNNAKKHALKRTEPILDWRPYVGAESWREFYKRVCDVMDDVYERDENLQILVSHSATIMNIVAWWLYIDIELLKKISFNVLPASITVLKLSKSGEHILDTLNCVSHLRGSK